MISWYRSLQERRHCCTLKYQIVLEVAAERSKRKKKGRRERRCTGEEVTSGTNSGKGLDKIEFISLLTGEDGCFLVVLYKLIHTAKTPLTDAEYSVLLLHLEVLVLPHSLQRNWEIAGLKKNKNRHGEINEWDVVAAAFPYLNTRWQHWFK